MKAFLTLILPYISLPVYAGAIYVSVVSLIKGNKFAEKKQYTAKQKKGYFVTWSICLLLFVFLTIFEIRDILHK